MEVGDWRTQLQAESRRKIVDNFMLALKRYFPFFGLERLQHELEKTAVRFEEEIYTNAKSQVDYLEQISLKMKTLETIPHFSMPSAESEGSLNSTDRTDNENGGDGQEEIYQKIKCMKDLYLVYVKDLHQRTIGKLQQKNSLPSNEQVERFKMMLEQFMEFLQIHKQNILPIHKDQLNIYEKHIIYVITSNRWKTATSQPQVDPNKFQNQRQQQQQTQNSHYLYQQQQQNLLQPPVMQPTMMQSVQSQQRQQQVQVQPTNMQQNQLMGQQNIYSDMQQQYLTGQSSQSGGQQRPVPKTSSTSLDWQEEVYQKIKAMKDLYQLDLIHMYHTAIEKIQQQPNNEQKEKLKLFKNMLGSSMSFLQLSKHNILPYHRDNFTTYQKQIVQIITKCPWKPAATQPPPPPPLTLTNSDGKCQWWRLEGGCVSKDKL